MRQWDDDVDLDEWADSASTAPSRTWLVVVAVVLMVPFVYTFAGGAHVLDALGSGALAVAVFFAVVALAYVGVRRWLRHRLEARAGTVWSDRR